MPGSFPPETLFAEVLAAPLAMPTAYRASLVALACERAEAVGATRDLEVELTSSLVQMSRGLAIDQLRLLIAQAWFPRHDRVTALARHLVRTARRYLRHRGTAIALRDGCEPDDGEPDADAAPSNAAESASRWRRMSQSLPPDLLIAALSAHAACPPRESVDLVTRQLDHHLRTRDFAESHLHIGAAFSFQSLWTGQMIGLLDLRSSLRHESNDALPMGGGAKMLAVAGVARLLMAAFLLRRRGAWEGFVAPQGELDGIARRCVWPTGAADAAGLAREALRCLETGRAAAVHPLRRLLVALTRTSAARRPPQRLADYLAQDPLHGCFGHPAETSLGALAFAESYFATEAIRYLLEEGAGDEAFARTFFQYERVRVAVYRELTQRAGTAGLDWFTRYYRRLSPWRGPLDERCFLFALIQQSGGLRLASLEGRTRPASRWTENRRLLAEVVRDTLEFRRETSGSRPEVGVVLHFIKDRAHTHPISRRSTPHALVADSGGMRHGRWLRERRREALALCRLLHVHPEALLVLRGLDVANVETAQPTWAFAPWIAMVRDASVRAAARAARDFPTEGVAPLAVTLHAGESYHRLSEGLRRMHEAVIFGVVHENGRFGHGLALGEDPSRWMHEHALSRQPLDERIDDLCWEFYCYQTRFVMPPRGRVSWLRAEIESLGRRMYGDGGQAVRAEDLINAWRRRFGVGVVEGAMDERRGEGLLGRYFHDDDVARRGLEVVVVEGRPDEAQALQAIQKALRELFAARSICIEANPSSNLLIADHGELREHPAFRLQPLEARSDLGPPVLLSVNTDNPVTMSSRLADENAYLLSEMLRLGAAPTAALGWIERAREDGMASRFTLPATRSTALLKKLHERLTGTRRRRRGIP